MSAAALSLLSLELAILIALAGAIIVAALREPVRAWSLGLVFTAAALGCSLIACAAFYSSPSAPSDATWSLQHYFLSRQWFGVDELSAPLVPLVALLHFLMALATGRTKMRRFSVSLSLATEAISLATFSSHDSWMLVALLGIGVIPPYLELCSRRQRTRLYILHMGLFVSLLVGGWALVAGGPAQGTQPVLAILPLLAAILIRCGSIPAHLWITDWFERASFGNALLFVAPLSGVYAAVRLVVPIAPEWALRSISFFSLMTALYAAGMAVVQKDTRRLFAYLFLSHASLVLVGIELHTPISFTGSLALWMSTAISLAGLGMTMRALEARFGRLPLTRFHGLYDHSPTLAICFLVMGLASAGFPGTFGFVAHELLIDGAVGANLIVGLAVALTAAINGIAVVRAYFCLFTGTRHVSTVFLGMTIRERLALLSLVALIIAGGLFPHPVIVSRHHAAEKVLQQRASVIDKTSLGAVADAGSVRHELTPP